MLRENRGGNESHHRCCRVVDIAYSFQICVELDSGYQVQIETEFALTDAAGASMVIDPETAGEVAKANLATLVGRRVDRGVANAAGDLSLEFDSGVTVRVSHNLSYEAWNLTGPNGYKVVSLPGDSGLAVWSSDPTT